MKYQITALLIVCTAALTADAAKGDSTKEQFMATQKANAEKKGVEFNAKKAEKMFDQLDANGDGIASGDDKKAYWNKGETTPAAPAKKLAKGDSTLEMFMATQKAQKEKKGLEFDAKKHEKMFEQMDTDGDGIVTGAEKKAYWNK